LNARLLHYSRIRLATSEFPKPNHTGQKGPYKYRATAPVNTCMKDFVLQAEIQEMITFPLLFSYEMINSFHSTVN
jgi:hypothetical protein